MNIAGVKAILPRKIRGANLDDIQGVEDFTLFKEAAGNVLRKIDPQRTRRRVLIQLYPGVSDYETEDDLKGNKVISLNPQGRRRLHEHFHQGYAEDIDDSSDMEYGVAYENNQKLLRIESGLGSGAQVDTTDSTDWAASGTASNLVEDSRIFSEGGLLFDVAVGTGILTWNGDQADLSDGQEIGAFFREIYIPDATKFTSITERRGSSAAAYWEMVGTPAFGSSFVTGVNLVKFNWDGATQTGSVTETAMDYGRIAIVMSASDVGLAIGPMIMSIPKPYDLQYYSNCLFLDADGVTFKETPDAEDDELLLEGNEENAFIYECQMLISEDMQRSGRSDRTKKKLEGQTPVPGIYNEIATAVPSSAQRQTRRWYKPLSFHRGGARTRSTRN